MDLSVSGRPLDPNYAHLHMLSFAYNPSNIGAEVPFTYGIIVEFMSDPFSPERRFLTCYDTGFVSSYSTHSGGNVNGHTLEYSKIAQLSSFEQFICAQTEIIVYPELSHELSLHKRSKQLVATAGGYLKHTKETIDIKEHQEVQFWFLTSSGIFSGGDQLFEIRNKTSVWTDLFNEVKSIAKGCQSVGPDKGYVSVSTN